MANTIVSVILLEKQDIKQIHEVLTKHLNDFEIILINQAFDIQLPAIRSLSFANNENQQEQAYFAINQAIGDFVYLTKAFDINELKEAVVSAKHTGKGFLKIYSPNLFDKALQKYANLTLNETALYFFNYQALLLSREQVNNTNYFVDLFKFDFTLSQSDKTSFKLSKVYDVIKLSIFEGNSLLKLISLFAITCLFISFLFALYVLLQFLNINVVKGFITTNLIFISLFSMQFLILAIIASYLYKLTNPKTNIKAKETSSIIMLSSNHLNIEENSNFEINNSQTGRR